MQNEAETDFIKCLLMIQLLKSLLLLMESGAVVVMLLTPAGEQNLNTSSSQRTLVENKILTEYTIWAERFS